jgi:hypothetical protein
VSAGILRESSFAEVDDAQLQLALSSARAEALREAANEVGDWEFPLDPDASKDAIAARVVLLSRLERLVFRLRERADRTEAAS